MPIFEYRCAACGEEFEELIFGDEIPPCPACSHTETTRLLSCACLHMPAPSRVGQTVTFPKPARSACGSCAGGSCATCR